MSTLDATATDTKPFVSIIMPCRHESAWIARCLHTLLTQDYPLDRMEVLVIDGMSTDGTREAVQSILEQHPQVRLLDNPHQIAPAALNIGIAEAKGDIVMRVDAHYEYQPDYVSSLVNWMQSSGADNVGGVMRLVPANDSAIARAIAFAMGHPFGIGNAHYRMGASEPRSVDTVAFGCYRKSVFERIGGFDEELVRNQDIEFNLRLRRAGGNVLLVPRVVATGHARGTLARIARMFYQYGYYNPLVIRKTGGRMSRRQAVTPLFAASVLGSAILAIWLPPMRLVLAAILVVYGIPMLACCARAARTQGLACALALCVVFPTLHISHGLGFLKGFLDFVVLRRNPHRIGKKVPITR